MSTRLGVFVLAAALAGCVKMTPPTPAPERPVLHVAAPFAATWDAVIDLFASRNIPIQTLDRSSGLVVAEMSSVPVNDATQWADCGSYYRGRPGAIEYGPTHAAMNVLVRADATGATVRATVRWTLHVENTTTVLPCETKNLWESVLESGVRAAAERAAPRAP